MERKWSIGLAMLTASLSAQVHAQSAADAAATLGRDVPSLPAKAPRDSVATPQVDRALNAQDTKQGAGGILVGGVSVKGAQALSAENFAPATDKFVGQSLTTDGLQKLARSVADEARARGYVFASAMVPEQEVRMGVVQVQLDEGRVDEVRISGSENQRLRRILEELIGPAVLKTSLERQLLLAEDLPSIAINGTRYVREGNRGVLLVDVKEDRATGAVVADTYGSKDFGPVRLRLDANLASMLVEGDELTVRAIGTPLATKELTYVAASYTVPLGDNGATLGISGGAGRTQPGEFPGQLLRAYSRTIAVNASYPVVRGNDGSLWLNAEAAYLNVDASIFGLALQRDDLVTVTLSANGNVKVAGGRLSGGLGVVRGLGILGATGPADPLASRADSSGEFTKFTGWLNWSGSLGGQFGLRLSANGQIATRPLLSAQEIGLGGSSFGRGYDYSERFGDSGVMGLVELRRDFDRPVKVIDWAQIYGFADGGYVYNLGSGFGGGSLMSAGAGMRAGKGPVELGVEAAFPVFEPRAQGGKSPRLNATVGVRF